MTNDEHRRLVRGLYGNADRFVMSGNDLRGLMVAAYMRGMWFVVKHAGIAYAAYWIIQRVL